MSTDMTNGQQDRGRVPNSPPDGTKTAVARAGGIITLLIKLGGLVIAGNEALFTEPPRDAVLFALAAFMMAGAQGLDTIIDNFLSGKSK